MIQFFLKEDLIDTSFQKLDSIDTFLKTGIKVTHPNNSGTIRLIKAIYF